MDVQLCSQPGCHVGPTLTSGAAEIEADVEIVIQALKMFGNRHSIAGMQALRAEKWRQSTADEMKSMEGDDVEESHGTKVMQNNMGPQS